MSVLVNTKNEKEEKVLLAFLNSLRYDYKAGIEEGIDQPNSVFISQYNTEIDQADADLESGNFIDHDDVEQVFHQRKKSFNGNHASFSTNFLVLKEA